MKSAFLKSIAKRFAGEKSAGEKSSAGTGAAERSTAGTGAAKEGAVEKTPVDLTAAGQAVFLPGQAVVVSRAGEQRVGEVVGTLEAAGVTLYEVSLEDVILKGVWPQDLSLATTGAIQATLGWLAIDPEFAQDDEGSSSESREGIRRALLRQAYAEFLQHALEALMANEAESACDANAEQGGASIARYAVGEHVAVREDEAWLLGTVFRAVRKGGEVTYTIEALGDVRIVSEQDLMSATDAPCPALGSRAYLVAEGHEADDDFAGTICKAEPSGDAWVFSLAFDDGDILEGLLAEDVIVR